MEIIEDCSPYYIKFTYDGIEETISLARQYFTYSLEQMQEKLQYVNMSPIQSYNFFKSSPVYNRLPPMDLNRVSYFISKPGCYIQAHKDGTSHKWGINFPVLVEDDLCETSWYNDEDILNYELEIKYSTYAKGFDKEKHSPVKSTVLRNNECIFLNIETFHDWDNTKSNNFRVVLTTRLQDHLYKECDFNIAKQLLFGNIVLK